jgi:hypothetical protein
MGKIILTNNCTAKDPRIIAQVNAFSEKVANEMRIYDIEADDGIGSTDICDILEIKECILY